MCMEIKGSKKMDTLALLIYLESNNLIRFCREEKILISLIKRLDSLHKRRKTNHLFGQRKLLKFYCNNFLIL